MVKIKIISYSRTDGATTSFTDLNEKININRFGLQNIEMKLEDFIQQTNERLDSVSMMLQQALSNEHNNTLKPSYEKPKQDFRPSETDGDESRDSAYEITYSIPGSLKKRDSFTGNMVHLHIRTSGIDNNEWNSKKESGENLQFVRQLSSESASRRKRSTSESGCRLGRESRKLPFTSFLPIKPAYNAGLSPPVSVQTRHRLMTMNFNYREREYSAITDHIEPHLRLDDNVSESSTELQGYFNNQETSTSSEMFKGELTKVEAYNEIMRQKLNSDTITEPAAGDLTESKGAKVSMSSGEEKMFKVGDSADEIDAANTSSEDQNDCRSSGDASPHAAISSEDENEEVARVVSNSLNILQESMNRGLLSKCKQETSPEVNSRPTSKNLCSSVDISEEEVHGEIEMSNGHVISLLKTFQDTKS